MFRQIEARKHASDCIAYIGTSFSIIVTNMSQMYNVLAEKMTKPFRSVFVNFHVMMGQRSLPHQVTPQCKLYWSTTVPLCWMSFLSLFMSRKVKIPTTVALKRHGKNDIFYTFGIVAITLKYILLILTQCLHVYIIQWLGNMYRKMLYVFTILTHSSVHITKPFYDVHM